MLYDMIEITFLDGTTIRRPSNCGDTSKTRSVEGIVHTPPILTAKLQVVQDAVKRVLPLAHLNCEVASSSRRRERVYK